MAWNPFDNETKKRIKLAKKNGSAFTFIDPKKDRAAQNTPDRLYCTKCKVIFKTANGGHSKCKGVRGVKRGDK